MRRCLRVTPQIPPFGRTGMRRRGGSPLPALSCSLKAGSAPGLSKPAAPRSREAAERHSFSCSSLAGRKAAVKGTSEPEASEPKDSPTEDSPARPARPRPSATRGRAGSQSAGSCGRGWAGARRARGAGVAWGPGTRKRNCVLRSQPGNSRARFSRDLVRINQGRRLTKVILIILNVRIAHYVPHTAVNLH